MTGRIVGHLPTVTFRLVLSADGRYFAAILVIAALRQGRAVRFASTTLLRACEAYFGSTVDAGLG